MTVATNIANQASNWSDSSVGSGALYRGIVTPPKF